MNKLQENTVILDVIYHVPGNTRHESGERVETDADKRWLGVTKRIFKSSKYDEICGIMRKFGNWLAKRSIPCGLHGYAVLPISLLPEVLERADQADADIRAKVEEFCVEFEGLKAQAKESLKELYDERNYPSTSHFRRGFGIERQLIELSIPNEDKVGKALAENARTKAMARWQSATDEAIAVMRGQFRDLVAHLAQSLEPSPDGSKKKLHESAIEKVIDWMRLFSNRNVLGDAEMDQVVAQAKQVLRGRGQMVDELREDGYLRSQVAAEMTKVKTALDGLVEAAPSRRIRFED